MQEKTLNELKELIVQYVDVTPEEITPEARFIEDLHFNSYDFMSLLGEVEENLGITIEDAKILDMHTVGDALSYLETLQSEAK